MTDCTHHGLRYCEPLVPSKTTIGPETLNILKKLKSKPAEVPAKMASKDSLPTAAEILARFYEAETIYMAAPPDQRDFASGMGRTLSPDLELYQSPDLMFSSSEYHGHEGFQKWSEEMAGFFSSLVVAEPKVYEREGANEVVVVSRLELTTREHGREWKAPLTQVVSVDREKGWITSIRPFYWDVAGLKKMLGLGGGAS